MNTSATTTTINKLTISNNNAINEKINTSYNTSSAMLMSASARRGSKRKTATATRKRRKLQPKAGESRLEQVPQTKNTVAVLNELKRNLVYKVESQTGPVHAPLFTISVVVDGQKFIGTGPSKKLARVAAAASALRSFIQFKDVAAATGTTFNDSCEQYASVGGTGVGTIATTTTTTTTTTIPKIITVDFIIPSPDSSRPLLPVPITNGADSLTHCPASTTNTAASTIRSMVAPLAGYVMAPGERLVAKTLTITTASTTVTGGPAAHPKRGVPGADDRVMRKLGAKHAHPKTLTSANTGDFQRFVNYIPRPDAFVLASGKKQPCHNSNNNHARTGKLLAPSLPPYGSHAQLKVSSGNAVRGGSASGGNVASGHHPKPQPEKGPVMLLHELFTDAHFECVSSDGLQHSKFTVVVTVNDNQRFEGTGPSKKMAKNAAAKAALASICNISFSPLQQSKFGLISAGASNGAMGGPSGVAMNGDSGFTPNKNFELPQTFADAIGKLVIEKFNEVMKGSDVYSRRKVLAGIVMTEGYEVKSARVISLATGTKCVSGEHMSVTGSVINDSHAEIIARRGLMDFLYSQLDLVCRQEAVPAAPAAIKVDAAPGGGQESDTNALKGGEQQTTPQQDIIFVKPSDGSTLYKLKDGIYFHLYINTAPCGDARVFSPHENDSMDVDKHPNRKARGQLRTKVESGEGTIPVKSSDGIQTWDGVLQGQRLLTMSCSDKISRWNVLGLQGSLLASIIEPIYLHSIVLGSLLHPAHMYRAICGRIESAIQGLPPPYRLNKPKLALMTSAESRNQTKPPNFSINWITNSTEVEIVNSFTGKLINNNTNTNKMSRLSKQSFYQRYSAVTARLPAGTGRDPKPLRTYFETKMAVTEYQQAKSELFAAFSKEDLGEWLKKPIDQDQFTLLVAKDSDGQQQLPPQPQPPPHQQPQTVPMPSENATTAAGAVLPGGNGASTNTTTTTTK
uniref:A to I editase domain-containing protein n=1 Tax=Anopheles farauti TaxID=69004 RepID=A0A182QTY8_9DIPT